MRAADRILLPEASSFSARGIQALAEIGPVQAFDLDQEALVKAVPGFEILVVRLGVQVDERILEAGSDLQIVATATTGLDHIDLAAAEAHGVHVLSLKGEREFLDQVYATAEHSFALLLSLVRHIPEAFSGVKDYGWRRDLYRGRELNGKTLGIVGCGRLGTMMARYALGFGMHVVVFDPYQALIPPGVEIAASLAEMLAMSEIVSIHLPLNAETEGLFSETVFRQMRPGSYLINTARGAIIDESALLQALASGRLAGAAVDVVRNEHEIMEKQDHPLIRYAQEHDNLLITPHIAGATQESVEKADLFLVNKLRRYLQARR